MADKNVKDLTVVNTLVDADKFIVVLNSNEEGRLIAKSDVSDVLLGTNVTITDLDKLSNVVSTSSQLNKLNSITAVTADFELLSGLGAFGLTTLQLQFIKGLTSPIQQQLNTKSTIASLSNRPYQYSVNAVLGGAITELKIVNTDMLTAVGIGSSYYIPSNSVQVSVWKQASVLSASEDKSAVIGITSATFGSSTYQMTYIDLSSLTASTTYDIYVTFKILAK